MSSIVDRIVLPPPRLGPCAGYSYYYGAANVAAEYCGLKRLPLSFRGWWMHGWAPTWYQIHPILLLHVPAESRKLWPFWVARQDEVEFLASHGIAQAEAIGLPMAYLPESNLPRLPNSLLVMPVHSLDYTQHQWAFDDYADAIAAIRDQFDDVLVCVHPSCRKHGYWEPQFRKRGFEVIEGTQIYDRNGLKRVHALVSQFEYVTTNGFGSHIAYAAAWGAKVSIHGPYARYTAQDYANDPFFLAHPYALEPLIEAKSEANLRRLWPHLFVHPRQATDQTAWGRHEIGYDCRRSPQELRQLFGWNSTLREVSAAIRLAARTAKRAIRRRAA